MKKEKRIAREENYIEGIVRKDLRPRERYPTSRKSAILGWKKDLEMLGKEKETVIAGYIVGSVAGAEARKLIDFEQWSESDPLFEEVFELAADLEVSNCQPEECRDMWRRLQKLIGELEEKYLKKESVSSR